MVQWFGNGVNNLPADKLGTYDFTIASGCFLHGHIPPTGFDDAHALLKTGGHFVIGIRSKYLQEGEEHGYGDHLRQMVTDGKFEQVFTNRWMRGQEGIAAGVFMEMESTLLCYKRLD